ncbi:FAD/NAD(P)-binding oxidoreductase [Dactylosporangium sp. NPDC005572]|uniref:NAD(P)/FAD-dependent oxidoreductase n=1 Tax=Dactylosporangium sp. NPDC005572 TaxID=3156889 RepID=UPI0033B836CD
MDRIVVVGASAAGLAAAEVLRREGFDGDLTLVGDERHLPYDRPPLSKQVLRGAWEPHRTALRGQEMLDALGARWHLGTRATGLDLAARHVYTAEGGRHDFDGLVIATGVTPKCLPGGNNLAGVHQLRTLDDALALRADLLTKPEVVVVGAGFLGAEAAAVAREIGLEVTLVDPLDAPLIRQFGRQIGDLVAELHRSRGVKLRLGVGVTALDTEAGRVSGVRLDDGTAVAAQLVLVSIGSTPNIGWLQGSGLSLSNGVDCDTRGWAAPGVVAAGDVANWMHPCLGVRVRVEHRLNATEQGTVAARTLLGIEQDYTPVPYFWTDQFDVRLQAYGTPDANAELTVVAGHPAVGRFAGIYSASGRVVAAIAWNMPREARELRQRVVDDLVLR